MARSTAHIPTVAYNLSIAQVKKPIPLDCSDSHESDWTTSVIMCHSNQDPKHQRFQIPALPRGLSRCIISTTEGPKRRTRFRSTDREASKWTVKSFLNATDIRIRFVGVKMETPTVPTVYGHFIWLVWLKILDMSS